MGFLAAWGVILEISTSQIAFGLFLVYMVTSLSIRLSRNQGWKMGVWLLMIGVGAGLSSMFFEYAQWYGLCIAIGILVFFKDQQTSEMLVWLPVRALKSGINNHDAIRMTTVLSAIILAICLTIAGFISQIWPWLPYILVFLALIFLVPKQIKTMGKPRVNSSYLPLQQSQDNKLKQNWLLRLAMLFNSANFLGRRLLLPVALLMIANQMDRADQAMPILGATLGIMGLIGALAKPPARFSYKLGPYDFLRWGARITLMGWIILSIGVLTWGFKEQAWIILIIFLGWVLLELANKTWSIAYMECLRLSSVENKKLATRSHKIAMNRFMVYKSMGGALGLGLASFLPGINISVLVLGLSIISLATLEKDFS